MTDELSHEWARERIAELEAENDNLRNAINEATHHLQQIEIDCKASLFSKVVEYSFRSESSLAHFQKAADALGLKYVVIP